jgi:hypothetical protein
MDTETSEILATEDVYDESKDIEGLRIMSDGIAAKLHRDFPLLDGIVLQHKDKHIFIDIGGDTIRQLRRFIVYTEKSMHHPITGKILGTDNIIKGHARIIQIMPEASKAEVMDGDAIETMDKVIAE